MIFISFEDYIRNKQKHLGHPMILPLMILESLSHFSITRRNAHQRSLYELEVRLGVTRGHLQAESKTGIDLPLGKSTTQCNHLITSLVYLDQRLHFVKSLAEEVGRQLNSLVGLESHPQIEPSNLYFMDLISNCLSFIDNQRNLILCLQKRAYGLLTVVRHLH